VGAAGGASGFLPHAIGRDLLVVRAMSFDIGRSAYPRPSGGDTEQPASMRESASVTMTSCLRLGPEVCTAVDTSGCASKRRITSWPSSGANRKGF